MRGSGLLSGTGWQCTSELFVLFILITAACSSTALVAREEDSVGSNSSSSSRKDEVVESLPHAEEVEFSPLQRFWNFGASPEVRAEELTAERIARQALLLECMGREGFEYSPVHVQEVDPALISGNTTIRARGQGFGITQNFEDPEWVIRNILAPLGVQDPNSVYIESLDEQTRVEYFERFRMCDEKAAEEAFGDTGYQIDDTLLRTLEDLEEQIQADPRIVDAIEEWQSCMASAGYNYLAPLDIITDISAQLQTILLGATLGDNFDVGLFPALLTEEPRVAMELVRTSLEIDLDALVSLRQYEVEVSDADLVCGATTAPILQKVRAEYETSFVGQFAAPLEEARQGLGGE